MENRTVPLYFVIPPAIHSGNTVRIPLAVVSDVIIEEGNLDPDKYYEIRTLDPSFPNNKGYEVGDRFTGIGANITGRATVSEVTGAYPLRKNTFNSSPVLGTLENGRVIVNLLFKKHFIRHIKKVTQADEEDVTQAQLLLVAKLYNAYIGRTRESVFNRFPELEGQEVIGQDVDGNDILRDKLMKHKWSAE